jgi:hypothetical protein
LAHQVRFRWFITGLPDGRYIFKPKIPIWLNLGESCKAKYWFILLPFGLFYINLVYLWPFGIFCGHLVYFYCFGMLFQEKSGNPGSLLQYSVKVGNCKNLVIYFNLRFQRLNFFGNDFFLFLNTKTLHIKSIKQTSIAIFPQKTYTGRDSNPGLPFLNRMRCPLRHAARATFYFSIEWQFRRINFL